MVLMTLSFHLVPVFAIVVLGKWTCPWTCPPSRNTLESWRSL